MTDPLLALPAEIVLRVLDFADLSTIASLLRTSLAWHTFIDTTHAEAIYSSPLKTHLPHSQQRQDPASICASRRSFACYYDGITSWKELCKRSALLRRNWRAKRPVTRESVIHIGHNPVWRFRADFKRKFIVSTSQAGGVTVTDMTTGEALWRLERDEVRPYAHLEYDMESGTAVWDRYGNAVEVWRADDDADHRGTFNRIAVLQHDCETRGYQLSYNALCVVSTEGRGFVYDMMQTPPQMVKQLSIDDEAVGHLDQNEDTVMYSMGMRGYHVYSKETGESLGKLLPSQTKKLFHIRHPLSETDEIFSMARHRPTPVVWPPKNPRRDRLIPLRLEEGSHSSHVAPLSFDEDEWGAGMLSGSFMVGVSKAGRIFICSNWREALRSEEKLAEHSALVECESDGSTFDLGGWLSIHNGRILFEINDRIYIFTLPDPAESPVPLIGERQKPIYATSQSSTPQLSVPVSFMAVWDDCLMLTYAAQTLGWRNRRPATASQDEDGRPLYLGAFPTKAIRVLSLAPDSDTLDDDKNLALAENEQEIEGATERMTRQATPLEIMLLSNIAQL